MRKIILLRILGCILFLSLMLYPSNPTAYYAEGNVFHGLFTEPVEVSYVIFWDGYMLKFTSFEDNRVGLGYGRFKELVEAKGRKIEDIAIKIHNHIRGFNFSDGDHKFRRTMRYDGFEGSYCLKPPTGKIKYRRDKYMALTQLLREKETKEFLKEYKKKYPEAYEILTDFILKEVAK